MSVYVKKGIKKIKCIVCLLERHVSLFHPAERVSETPRCRKCLKERQKMFSYKGIEAVVDFKRCLKCDAKFKSYNGKRLCDSCKGINKNTY